MEVAGFGRGGKQHDPLAAGDLGEKIVGEIEMERREGAGRADPHHACARVRKSIEKADIGLERRKRGGVAAAVIGGDISLVGAGLDRSI